MKNICIAVTAALLILCFKAKGQNSSPPLAKGQEKFTNKPKLIRGPYLQVATDTSMVIRWRTDAATRSRVRYGTGLNNLDQHHDDPEYKTEHEIKIGGLQPGTKYYYSVGSLRDTLQYGPANYFSTLPSAGKRGDYRIGVFGDCGYLSINQANVRDQFLKYLGNRDLDAWILLGDNAYNDGNDMEYQAKFFNPYKEVLLKKYPVFPNPGNHDYHDADFTEVYAQQNHTTAYYSNFSMPVNGESGGLPSHNASYYSFDIGNIHFISLDSYGMEAGKYFLYDTLSPQVIWLKQDLAANRNTDWVVAFWHYPPYSKGTHDSDEDGGIMAEIRQNFIGILERAHVDLILCGHSHVYERSRIMNGHFGKSSTFNAARYNLSQSSGAYDDSSHAMPYVKAADGPGTVYVVSGSSSYVSKSYYDFPHKAMYYSDDKNAGAGMLEVRENRLDFKWICADGAIRDQFTMMKDVNRTQLIQAKKGQTVRLTASFITEGYEWNKSKAHGRSIEVKPSAGKTIYTVKDIYGRLKDTFEVQVK